MEVETVRGKIYILYSVSNSNCFVSRKRERNHRGINFLKESLKKQQKLIPRKETSLDQMTITHKPLVKDEIITFLCQ